MFRTILYVLLKSLIITEVAVMLSPKVDIIPDNPQEEYVSMSSDVNFTQDIAVSEKSEHHILQNLKSDHYFNDVMVNDGVIRNKIPDILANISLISEPIGNISSKPTSPRAFVEFYNGFTNKRDDISITFRWNQPEFADKVIQGYTVRCWFIENFKKIQTCNDTSILATILEYTVDNVKSNTIYYFQVQAVTDVGSGSYTETINVSTMHENPIPKLLIISKTDLKIWDLDLNTVVHLVNQSSLVMTATYSIAEHKIYSINFMRELMIFDMNKNDMTKIATLEYHASNLCIDWVARNLYWIEHDFLNTVNIIKRFDLTLWQNGTIKYDKILKGKKEFFYLTTAPLMGILYWITFNEDRQYNTMQLPPHEEKVQIIKKNTSFACDCPFDISKSLIFRIDDTNPEEPLIYWILKFANAYFLIVTDINICTCNLIMQIQNVSVTRELNFITIDKKNIYFSNAVYQNFIYVLEKKYALLESIEQEYKNVQKINRPFWIDKYYTFGKSVQLYPPTRCLTPDENAFHIENVAITTNSIGVSFSKLIPKNGCKSYNLPTTLHIIYISHCADNELNKYNNYTVKTYERYYEIRNLTPLTEYKLQLALSNFYSDQLSMSPLFGSELILKTKPGKLDAPENVTVQALTPITAAVYWMPPKNVNCVGVIYEVRWKILNVINDTQQINIQIINNIEHEVDGKYFTNIQSLLPGQKYMVYVRVYPANYSNFYNDSVSKTLYMYSEPNNITLNSTSVNSMNISWIPNVNLMINYVLEYKNIKTQKWQIADNFELINEEIMYCITNLLPGTLYTFRLILRYPKYEDDFIWPSDERFTFKTIGNFSRTTWVLEFFLPFILHLFIIITIIWVCYFYYMKRQRKEKSEQIELSILHDNLRIPHENFNTIYKRMLQYNPNEHVLMEVNSEQITLSKLLGSGAFGKVFQGTVKDLEREGTETPAAIKVLREDASEQEKKKFLEEAKLMNHFRNKHILRLLAVCLYKNDPLIMFELMETDLLKFLRESRELQPSDSKSLRLQDLLAMCEDVARGCCYLEELRFVHRDLACRNCLISGTNRENRIVKIGDFGLARDVYQDHYYRAKEGVFPVRWMAPESLTIGLFTSQSDVWSFGVLMWEITSLGEEPYCTKTNTEVLNYVKTGGRLSIRPNCPSILYQLMLRCWYAENARPHFNICLKDIIALRNDIEDALLSPVDIKTIN